MLAVQVELLTGLYVATRFNDRSRVEWPPHPSRLFSAAVAAWAEAGDEDPAELMALEWWEHQGAPQIACSWGSPREVEGWERSAVVHYVPDNDPQAVARDTARVYEQLDEARAEAALLTAPEDRTRAAKAHTALARVSAKAAEASARVSGGVAPESALELLPDRRGRKARWYPTIVPALDRITYVWPSADPPPAHIDALDGLLSRIGRLGHSSSLVSVEVVDGRPEPVLVADEAGQIPLRIAGPGQVQALKRAFASHGGTEPRTLPALVETYRPVAEVLDRYDEPRSLLGSDWVVLGVSGRPLGLRDCLGVAKTIRMALMSHSEIQPAPPMLSGHEPGPGGVPTAPVGAPHLAIVPLPFVGHTHGDGLIRGIALVVPRGASRTEAAAVHDALGRWLGAGGELQLGRRGLRHIRVLDLADAGWSEQPSRWCSPCATWVSVTPVALDRFPGHLGAADPALRQRAEEHAVQIVTASCEHIGLPRPSSVAVTNGPLINGARPARWFPPYTTQGGRLRRSLVHVRLEFDQPVGGPVVVGAGRYLGYGLCAPLEGSAS